MNDIQLYEYELRHEETGEIRSSHLYCAMLTEKEAFDLNRERRNDGTPWLWVRREDFREMVRKAMREERRNDDV